MKVVRKDRRGLPITLLSALAAASACFLLGLMLTRMVAGTQRHDDGSSAQGAPLGEGSGE